MERVLGEALARAQARGELASGKDPMALARFLVVVLHGLNVATKANAGRDTLLDAVNLALQALD
jgi:TetR/AcrR family transcriptional repressor of nem operon